MKTSLICKEPNIEIIEKEALVLYIAVKQQLYD